MLTRDPAFPILVRAEPSTEFVQRREKAEVPIGPIRRRFRLTEDWGCAACRRIIHYYIPTPPQAVADQRTDCVEYETGAYRPRP